MSAPCNCKKVAPSEVLTFQRCARGFILRNGGEYGHAFPTIYAFDRIDDLAEWLVEQYAEYVG